MIQEGHTEAEALADQLDGDEESAPLRASRRNIGRKWKQGRHAGGGPALSRGEIDSRKGDVKWCQICLKRHVNPGYKYCFWCSK